MRRGTYRVRGEVIDVFPAESETEALRIELFDGEMENMSLFDPLTGETMRKVPRYTVYPRTHYASTRESVLNAIETIKVELKERLEQLYKDNKLVEAQRLRPAHALRPGDDGRNRLLPGHRELFAPSDAT